MLRLFFIILIVLNLFSCAGKKFNLHIDSQSCQNEGPEFQERISELSRKVLKCWESNNQKKAAESLNSRLTQTGAGKLKFVCSGRKGPLFQLNSIQDRPIGYVVQDRSQNKESDSQYILDYFGFAADLAAFEQDDESKVLRSLTQTCCIDNSKLNKNSKDLACRQMANYSFSAFDFDFAKDYLFFLNSMNQPNDLKMSYFLESLSYFSKQNTLIKFRVLNLLIDDLSESFVVSNISRIQRKKLSHDMRILMSYIIYKTLYFSKSPSIVLNASKRIEKITNNFYSHEAAKEKLMFYTDIAEALNAVSTKNSTQIQTSWSKIRERALYLCRDFNNSEEQALKMILKSYSKALFDLKSELGAGDFFEMATYWGDICSLQKSYLKN